MTSAERATRESGYESDGKTAYGFFLPAGTTVAVRVKRGGKDTDRWVWYTLEEDVVTGRGDKSTNEDHPIDPKKTRDRGYDIGTVRHKGFEIRYIRNADLAQADVQYRTHPCLCDGKGEIEEAFYGRLKGHKWRVKCGPRCTWVKPRRTPN